MSSSKSSSQTGTKSKKGSKMKSKAQAHSSTQHDGPGNEKSKSSPSKDSQEYAGISADSISIYAEQSHYEHLSGETCDVLTEDINYKLRYIIHNALVKAKLQGREVISSDDIDETFTNLKIEKVYGAPDNPVWLNFAHNSIYYLDDQKVDLLQIAEEENTYSQEGNTLIDQIWLPDGNSCDEDSAEYKKSFREYFTAICEAVVSNVDELRYMALKDISVNASIGPITDWFYNFAYFLLMKDISYDSLTLKALQLLEVLENSPLSSLHASGKQLKLLVRLILQRLLRSKVATNVLRPMCYVLSLLCLHPPIKKIVINKIKEISVSDHTRLPLAAIIYYLGLDAVQEVFLPNIEHYLMAGLKNDFSSLTEIFLAIYGLICKANINESHIYFSFREIYGNTLVPYWTPKKVVEGPEQMEVDFVHLKNRLLQSRRDIPYKNKERKKWKLNEVFEIPKHDCLVKKKLDKHWAAQTTSNLIEVTRLSIGRVSLLLSILKCDKTERCIDHSLLNYY